MRILVAGSISLFTGREELYWTQAISAGIKKLNHEVDMFMLPMVQNPLLLPEQMTALRLLETENSGDILLAVGYPAFVLKHPKKRVLLFSLASNLHEWFDSEFGVLSTPQYNSIRNAVHAAEKNCLNEAERILCASNTLANQLKNEYNLDSSVLIMNENMFDSPKTSVLTDGVPRIVCETTLEPYNRVDLLLNAVACSKEDWNFHIFLPSVSDVYHLALIQRIQRMGIKERVFITEGSLSLSVLQRSSAFVIVDYLATRIPDSLLKAVKTHTPIITTNDCGALLEVTTNDANGVIVEPNAKNISQAIDLVVTDGKLRQKIIKGDNKPEKKIAAIDAVLEGLVG